MDDLELSQISNAFKRTYFVPKKDEWVMKRFLSEKPFQFNNILYVKNLLGGKCNTIVDVGANIGVTAIEYATFSKRVVAFEPSPLAFMLAKRNVEANKLSKGIIKDYDIEIKAEIDLQNFGIGGSDTTLTFNENKVQLGLSSVYDGKSELSKKEHLITVPIRKLDSFNLTNVDFIKVDTEGYEYEILKGAINTIKNNRPIIQLEIEEKFCTKYGYKPQDIFDFFNTFNNYLVYINTGECVGNKWKVISGKGDRFFVPQERIKNESLDKYFKVG